MAELTDQSPTDVVRCRCGLDWDRNVYSQCGGCTGNLWDVEHLAPKPSESNVPPGSSAYESQTFLEEGTANGAGLDLLVCGHRLTVGRGQTLSLGREDDGDTSDVFRDVKSVSRRHASLRFDGERLFVTDVGSANGTYVGVQQLPVNTEYELRPGQALRLASNVHIDIQWEN